MRLAICGKMRSGKDTAAEYIQTKLSASIFKFADPLYQIEKACFDIVGQPIPEDKTKRRRLLQFIGTEWGRETIDKDLWVKVMDTRLRTTFAMMSDYNVIVTDARFPNEIECLLKHNFKFINIFCKDEIRQERGATLTDHTSETSLDNYEFPAQIITNNFGLNEFHASIDDYLRLNQWI